MNERLEELLRSIIHPETERNIVDSGFVDRADLGDDGSGAITLRFQKARDPFAQKIKRQVEELMERSFPESKVMVIIREAAPKPRSQIIKLWSSLVRQHPSPAARRMLQPQQIYVTLSLLLRVRVV